MNGFRANSLISPIGLAVALAVSMSNLAMVEAAQQIAQTTTVENPANSKNAAPVRLGPRRSIVPGGSSSGAAALKQPVKVYTPVSPSSGSDGPVAIQTLTDLDSDSVGVIDETSGGLGTEMWQGSSRSFVTRAIALLPARVGSPTMRQLMRRLLLTQAVAPKRTKSQPGLFPLRVGALFASGDLKSALSLISSSSGPPEEYLVRVGIDGRLFGNDTAGACQQVRAFSGEFKGVYWQQAAAFCLAMAGKNAEAALMSDVLAERTDAIHPAFFAAMERLSGASPPQVDSLTGPTALHLSLMRSAGLALPEDVIEKASPAALRAIALSPNATLDLRLVAAEQATKIGVLSGKKLSEIYSAVAFDPSVVKNAVNHASENWGPGGRALLVQAALRQDAAVARAKIIEISLKTARQKGDWRVTALAFAPMVAALTPSTQIDWFAGDAARILITTGDIAGARKWLEFANTQALKPEQKATLWPLQILLSDSGIAETLPETIQTWWNARANAGAPVVGEARTLFSLLNTMGASIPSELWALILDDSKQIQAVTPSVSVRNALDRAAATGSRGGTIAMVLVALGEMGADPANLSAIELSIAALKRIGFEKEAKALALEVAIEAGL
ncbi:MAG: hypothetical protein CMM52_10320 [Rhodospirillaceae bacterium]|nr:hypothetical protein [Rhodospirillaceae bacterium]|tara:strand:- start:46247 stop:48094 length:1848 start_codon:yes stop_codon:yes gene_type:complete